MVLASKAISEKELKEAAEYYAAIGPERQRWVKTASATAAFAITLRAAARSHCRREWSSKWRRTTISFGHATRSTAASSQYVRADDLALGETVATAGACGTCHGADYKGVGDVPRLAGQHAVYLIRQLKDMQIGARKDKNVALMKPIVEKLSDREIVAVSAYLASKNP
jgi:cytochrome c553